VFLRNYFSVQTKSGLNHAKSMGKVLGRPKNSVIDQQIFLKKYKNLSADLMNGLSCRKAAKVYEV
jgi:hypothetical protein